MHKPTEDDRKTFARTTAKAQGISVRTVRKARQKGEMGGKAVEMPQARPGYEREVRFRPRWDCNPSNDGRWQHQLGVPQRNF
jgi:hypothetical protein